MIMDLSTFGKSVLAERQNRRMSQADLAKLVSTSQSTIDRVEKGHWAKVIPFIAEALKLEPPEGFFSPIEAKATATPVPIIHGTDLVGDRDLPVFASAEGGDGQLVLTTDAIQYVRRPEPLRGVRDGYAVLVVSNSMFPVFEPGDMALVHPHLPPLPDTDVVLYNDDENGTVHVAIKRLLKHDKNTWFLRQWNPPEGETRDFEWDRMEWQKCHRVVGKYSRR